MVVARLQRHVGGPSLGSNPCRLQGSGFGMGPVEVLVVALPDHIAVSYDHTPDHGVGMNPTPSLSGQRLRPLQPLHFPGRKGCGRGQRSRRHRVTRSAVDKKSGWDDAPKSPLRPGRSPKPEDQPASMDPWKAMKDHDVPPK